MVDLTLLYSRYVNEIELDNKYKIPKEYYENTEILDLTDIDVHDGKIENENDDFVLKMNVSGKMKINDSITMEEVWYPFNIEINENLEEFNEKNKNSLDIIEILWQNILVEIPSKVRATDEDIELSGDGWRVISEEKYIEERKARHEHIPTKLDLSSFKTRLNTYCICDYLCFLSRYDEEVKKLKDKK